MCEHTVNTVPCESFVELQPGSVSDSKGEEWKSSEVNARAVSRGQNKLIGEFKKAAGDVIGIMEYTCAFGKDVIITLGNYSGVN